MQAAKRAGCGKRGHPLKGTLSREKSLLCKGKGDSLESGSGRDSGGSMVQSFCTLAVVSLGSSVSDFLTAPVTHQNQGRSRNRRSVLRSQRFAKRGDP